MNLNQVTVAVSNVETSIRFYEQLGLKLIVSASHYARFECPKGDSTFSIHQADRIQNDGSCRIYFEVEELDKYVCQLADKGVRFEESPTDKTWLWREARLKDPDNNQIILYFAGSNRKYPPWRVN